LFRGWTVNDGPGGTSRTIVRSRDAGIGMVPFKMMIEMTIMAQTRYKCVSCSGINEKKADQASSESSHGNSWFYLRLYAFSRRGVNDVN
jgi:hypothetical protein